MAQTVGEIRLIADGTKVGFNHQLLIIALAYRRRALPIAWTWVRCAKGHSSARKQLALLAYVRGLIPASVPVLLVGDSEFGAVSVIRQLEKWHWSYVLRQKANHQVKLAGSHHWQRLRDLIHQPGQSVWLGPALLTAKYAHPVSLLLHWKMGEDEPWLLATNLSARRETLWAYRRRMWIEEMFGDLKGRGFDLRKYSPVSFCPFVSLDPGCGSVVRLARFHRGSRHQEWPATLGRPKRPPRLEHLSHRPSVDR